MNKPEYCNGPLTETKLKCEETCTHRYHYACEICFSINHGYNHPKKEAIDLSDYALYGNLTNGGQFLT